MKVRNGEIKDIIEVLRLEYQIYPSQWHVTAKYVRDLLQQNNDVLRVLEVGQSIKGHYSFIPLEKEQYENVLNGELDEKNLTQWIMKYEQPKEVYLYWTTVMVDLDDPNRKQLAKCLLDDIPVYLKGLTEKGITIKEIGGIFISIEGERLANRFGLKLTNTIQYIDDREYPVYRGIISSNQ